MSNGQSPPPVPPAPQGAPPPPPPPAAPAAPSYSAAGSTGTGSSGGGGMPTWAKVAIGCGCLTLLIAGVIVTMVGLGVKKGVDTLKEEGVDIGGAMEALKDAENNPGAAVEAIISLNPGLDVVENDPEAGRITIRNTETGEEGTFDYSDIEAGRISFDTDEGSYSMDASDTEGGGSVTFSGPEGESRVNLGTSLEDVPAWVPRYTNIEGESGGMTNVSGETASGIVTLESADSIETIEAWYTEQLEGSDFTVERSEINADGNQSVILQGKKDGVDMLTIAIARQGGAAKTSISAQYSGPKG